MKEEFVDEIRIHEEILLESDWLASAKTNLKNHLYEIQSGNKDQKSFVKTATSVVSINRSSNTCGMFIEANPS